MGITDVELRLGGRDPPITGLVIDLSLGGCRVTARDPPPIGSDVVLTIHGPTRAVAAEGQIRWRHCDTVGIAFARVEDRASLRSAILAFAYEVESARPAALILVDPPDVAARVATLVRRFGYIPRLGTTPLDVAWMVHGTQPRLALAIVGASALGRASSDWVAFLDAERPDLHIVIDGDSFTSVEKQLLAIHEPPPAPVARRKHHITRIVRHRASR